MSIAEALQIQTDASKATADEGGKIVIRDLQSTPVDTTVNAIRKSVDAADVDGEIVSRSAVTFIVASKDLGSVEPDTDWLVIDGAGSDPPAVDVDNDPIGVIVAIRKVRAGMGLSALHYLICDFGLTN